MASARSQGREGPTWPGAQGGRRLSVDERTESEICRIVDLLQQSLLYAAL